MRHTAIRRIMRHLGVLLVLAMVLGSLPLIALAATLEPYPSENAKTTLYRDESGTFQYRFQSAEFGQEVLPPEFGQVLNDYNDTYSVHGNSVNFYYTINSADGEKRAVYCYEPSNQYIFEYDSRDPDSIDAYDILRAPRSTNTIAAITQEQRDMLAYVLANGVSIYTNTNNGDQVATQLAVWMVGTGHYDDRYFDLLLPPAADDCGVAPNDAICKKARELVLDAKDCVRNRPSFASDGTIIMNWDGVQYTATLTDTGAGSSDWFEAIESGLQAANMDCTVENGVVSISGDPGAGGTEVSVMLGSGQKADIVFMDNEIEEGSRHTYFTSRQAMVTLNTLELVADWRFTLLRSGPAIATSAKNPNTGRQVIDAAPNALIRDTVRYTALSPDTEYILIGTLMYRSTGEAVTVDGLPVTATTEFTPTKAEGSEDVDFVFDATALAGKTLVVFEELYVKEGYVEGQSDAITEHKNIQDAAQSIYVSTPEGEGNAGDNSRDEPSGREDKIDSSTPPPPAENPNKSTPTITPETPYVPGGKDRDVPPVPRGPGNRLVPDGDGWIEIDDNDVPLGRWDWDSQKLEWIFDDDVPLADNPQTGGSDLSTHLLFLMGVSLIGFGAMVWFGRRKRPNMDRR